MENIIQKLRELLGTETAGAWVDFMRIISAQLPFLLDSGRPSAAVIEASIIGQAGFKSWGEMLKAPKAAGGLGWNLGGWKQYRRALGAIEKFPYLEELGLSASQIVSALNRSGDLPATLEDWNDAQKLVKAESEQKRMNSLSDARKVAESALERAGVAEKQTEQLQAELDQVNVEKLVLVQRIEKFNSKGWLGRAFSRP